MGIATDFRDGRLVGRALNHDSVAFETLVRLHLPSVSAVAMAYTRNGADADDVIQEAFLKAWQSLDTLRTPGRFGAWVTTIARNTAINHLNRKRHDIKEIEHYRAEAAMAKDSASSDRKKAMRELLPGLIAALPEADRELVLLRYYAGKKTREIAESTASSHAAVRKRLERIRHALGEALLASLAPHEAEKSLQERHAHRVASAVVAVTPAWKHGATGSASAGASAALAIKAAVSLAAFVAILGGGYLALNKQAPSAPETEAVIAITADGADAPSQAAEESVPAPLQPTGPEQAPLTSTVTGASIGGRVIEKDTLAGVAGAVIEMHSTDVRLAAHTDPDGDYGFEGLPPGEYWLELNWDDDLCWRYPRSRYERQEQNVRVAQDESVTDVNFVVLGGVRVKGRVAGPDGAALAGTVVEAWSEPNAFESKTTCDAGGHFEFRGFGTDAPAYFWPHHEGYAMAPHGPITIPAGGLDDLVLTMRPESSISGILVDQDGEPLPGVTVWAWPERVYSLTDRLITDENGRFRARGLHPSTYKFSILLPEDSTSHPITNIAHLELAEGQHLTDVTLVYEIPAGLTISGRITDDQGEPQDHVRVWTSRGSDNIIAETDDEGRYELVGVDAGVYTIIAQGVSWQGPGLSSAEAEAGEQNVDFIFSRPATVSGVVVDAVTSSPVPQFEVMCPGPAMRWTSFRNSDGAFELPAIRVEDPVTLAARAEGYATGLSEQLTLVSGEPRENVVIRLQRAGKVMGRVFAPDGTPLRDANVGIDDRMFGGGVQTNAQGEYGIVDARPGTWPLRAWHPNYAPGEVRVTVAAGESVSADIHMQTGARVVGTVTRGGEAQSNVRVELIQWMGEHVIGFHKECSTDDDGRFEFDGVPAAELLLHINPMVNGQGRVIDLPVVIVGSEEKVVDLEVFDGTASAAFNITLDDALASRQGSINVELEYRFDSGETEKYYAYTPISEPVRLEGLRPGAATLTAKYFSSGLREVLATMEPIDVSIQGGVENHFELAFEATRLE